MEHHFFILSRLGFILKGLCSPLNVFLSYYYFLFLAPWPWLPGCSAKLLKTPPSSPRLPQSLPLAGLGPGRDLSPFWRGHELSSTINSSKFEIFGTHPGNTRIPRTPIIRCHQPRLGTTLTHAPGVRMTWVHKQTPSNHLWEFFLRKSIIIFRPNKPK